MPTPISTFCSPTPPVRRIRKRSTATEAVSPFGGCGTSVERPHVDAYEFVAPDGESYPVLDLNTPYIGGDHTKPNYNQQALAAGYDPQDPYASLDPRFYASIYYNGAQRNWTVRATGSKRSSEAAKG